MTHYCYAMFQPFVRLFCYTAQSATETESIFLKSERWQASYALEAVCVGLRSLKLIAVLLRGVAHCFGKWQ